MIINSKKEEIKETKKTNKVKDFFKKLNYKKIGIIAGIVLIIIIGVFFYKKYYEGIKISIDIASDNIVYEYGPNSITNSTLKVGNELKLKVIVEGTNKFKCYSADESIIDFTSDNIATAKKIGSTEVYCKARNVKSNIIEVNVGE